MSDRFLMIGNNGVTEIYKQGLAFEEGGKEVLEHELGIELEFVAGDDKGGFMYKAKGSVHKLAFVYLFG